MTIHRGFGASIGIGVESTWGTAVSRTNWLRAASHGVIRKRTKNMIPHLGGAGEASTNYRYFYNESDFVEGPIAFPVAYDDSSVLMLRHILGANATAGAGPYTHTLTLGSPLPNGLTLEMISGTAGSGTAKVAEVFEGCLLGSARLEVSAGGVMTCETQVMGETSQGIVSPGTPTYSSSQEWVQHSHAGTFTVFGSTVKVQSMSINIDRGLQRNHELGSLLTSQPYEGRLQVDVDLTTMWQSDTFYDALLADTQNDATITFTGTGNNALAITLQNAVAMEVSRPVNGAEGISQTIRMRCFSDGTDEGLKMVFTNDNVAHSTN